MSGLDFVCKSSWSTNEDVNFMSSILAFSLSGICGSLPKCRLGRCSTITLRCMGTQAVIIDFSFSFVAGPDWLMLGSVRYEHFTAGPSVLDRWKHFATVTTGAYTWSEIQTQDVINLGCVWNDIPRLCRIRRKPTNGEWGHIRKKRMF